MSQTYKSIFTRCEKCQALLLEDEKHECKERKVRTNWNLLESVFQILSSEGYEMNQSDITRIINKEFGSQHFTQHQISYYLKHKPEIFKPGIKKYHWALKIWDSKA